MLRDHQTSCVLRLFPDVSSKSAEQHQIIKTMTKTDVVTIQDKSRDECESPSKPPDALHPHSEQQATSPDARVVKVLMQSRMGGDEVKFSSAARSRGVGAMVVVEGLLRLAIATAVTHCAAIDLTPTSGRWLESRSL